MTQLAIAQGYLPPELKKKSRQIRFSDVEWKQVREAADFVQEDIAVFVRKAVRQRIDQETDIIKLQAGVPWWR